MTRLFAKPKLTLIPRSYQSEDLEESFRQWDAGVQGTLTRIFTGGGKTIVACICADRWLAHGDDCRVMVISYEQQLVWQFAQEIEDFMGLTPGIEMGSESVGSIPPVVVASRQSLAPRPLATQEQRMILGDEFGITDLGLTTLDLGKSLIKQLRKGMDKSLAVATIEEHNANQPMVNHEEGSVSRLYKYPHEFRWLVIVDEAHKASVKKAQTAHWYSWFAKNPHSRRKGLTATPKRSDGVSIGDKLFPGVTIDYPLFSLTGRCAVKDGYAVPYVQKYVEVEGVDFKALKQVAGDFDENELEKVLAEEQTLASFCGPTLDLVGDRRSLIFCPTVAMGEKVTSYINARQECRCKCGAVGWYPRPMIGDGATCRTCGEMLPPEAATAKDGPQAMVVHGGIAKTHRKEIYRQHQGGVFQFLVAIGLCREGYNDRQIACVAVFRPVSKKASSLAEQMKGRSSRPLPNLIEGIETAEERRRLIRESAKPDALIIDLVGITGLADCATTAEIYGEGLPDDVLERATQIAMTGGVPDIAEAIEQAQREAAEERERQRKQREEREARQREEAERRALVDAQAKYTTHETGHGSFASGMPGMATEKQLRFLHVLGMDFAGWEPTMKQAGRMITQLKEEGKHPSEVAYLNGIKDGNWKLAGPSVKQMQALAKRGINAQGMTPSQVQQAFSTGHDPRKQASENSGWVAKIKSCDSQGLLDSVRDELVAARKAGTVSDVEWASAVSAGREQRERVF